MMMITINWCILQWFIFMHVDATSVEISFGKWFSWEWNFQINFYWSWKYDKIKCLSQIIYFLNLFVITKIKIKIELK